MNDKADALSSIEAGKNAVNISFSLSPEDYREIEENAKKLGVTPQDVLTALVRSELQKENKQA